MADVFTIDDLNALAALTAADEVPVWDSEESGEPTKKITAQNMANSVKSLASLPNTTEMNTAIDQSTADVIRTGDVVNNLTSTNTDKPLSANMGKALNDKLTIKTTTITVTTNANGVFGVPTNICKPSKQILIAAYMGNGGYGYIRTDSISGDLYGFMVLNLLQASYSKVANTELTITIAYIDLA